ncbi:hypothetical protein DERP_014863 [Dermatophagoides pteronyssinus]|uniref:Uncharacterized protein n=1 Tax=Dermatophagoides pteronyssinus TaxID=6956 RepID=A0ABQ8J4U6_DERPT|nr:hypothetical protein DERP_014863 [Dermatophagoides pteronyssinus]
MLFWCKKFSTAKPSVGKESSEETTNNKVATTKIYKTEDFKFKDADPLNFPLWFSIIEAFKPKRTSVCLRTIVDTSTKPALGFMKIVQKKG